MVSEGALSFEAVTFDPGSWYEVDTLSDLDEAERAALSAPDFGALLELGGLPNLVYRYYRLHGNGFADFTASLGRAGG